MLATYLVAYNVSGIIPNTRKSHVRTLAGQIVVHPPGEVTVVCEANEAHDESPDVPLDNVLVAVHLLLGQKAADSALCGSWNTVSFCMCTFCTISRSHNCADVPKIISNRFICSGFCPPKRKSPFSSGVTGKRNNIWMLKKPQLGGGLIGYVKSKTLRNGQIISIDVLVVVMITAVFHEKLI